MNGTSTLNGRHQGPNSPILVLEPVNDTFALKSLELAENTRVKIGRQTGVATAPHPSNGYFDSKVLSRVHAEVWSESGKVSTHHGQWTTIEGYDQSKDDTDHSLSSEIRCSSATSSQATEHS